MICRSFLPRVKSHSIISHRSGLDNAQRNHNNGMLGVDEYLQPDSDEGSNSHCCFLTDITQKLSVDYRLGPNPPMPQIDYLLQRREINFYLPYYKNANLFGMELIEILRMQFYVLRMQKASNYPV